MKQLAALKVCRAADFYSCSLFLYRFVDDVLGSSFLEYVNSHGEKKYASKEIVAFF